MNARARVALRAAFNPGVAIAIFHPESPCSTQMNPAALRVLWLAARS